MPLELKTEYAADTARLICSGRVVAGHEAEQLDANIRQLLWEVEKIHLDLANVTFLDSSGIGVLVRHLVQARAAEKVLRITAVSPQARLTLEATHVLSQFQPEGLQPPRIAPGTSIVFVHPSPEIRTFVTSLLTNRGAAVSTFASMYDAPTLRSHGSDYVLIVTEGMDVFGAAHPKTIHLVGNFFDSQADAAAEDLVRRINASLGENKQ